MVRFLTICCHHSQPTFGHMFKPVCLLIRHYVIYSFLKIVCPLSQSTGKTSAVVGGGRIEISAINSLCMSQGEIPYRKLLAGLVVYFWHVASIQSVFCFLFDLLPSGITQPIYPGSSSIQMFTDLYRFVRWKLFLIIGNIFCHFHLNLEGILPMNILECVHY